MKRSSALQALIAARPQLTGVSTAGTALGLKKYELLHAGPPLLNPCEPPPPLTSSIVMTCLYEGWADDPSEAEALVFNGTLRLRPAQSLGCAAPLFTVISSGTPLFEVADEESSQFRSYAPVSTVRGADTRMGARDFSLMARLQIRDTQVTPALQRMLDSFGPLALWPLAIEGLNRGDDLHSRTTGSNDALSHFIRTYSDSQLADDISATPLFFLTLWMAAAQLILRAAEGGDVAGLITRAGGNGEQFGIALAQAPDQWITCKASPPKGPLLPHIATDWPLAGAVGDSAIIDFLGFGGQRLHHAPEPFNAIKSYLPASVLAQCKDYLLTPQPILPDHWPLGICVADLVAKQRSPTVMLALVAADGLTGLAGRGFYQAPLALFEAATATLKR